MRLRWALGLMILSVVTGMLVSTGATAAMAFPTVKKLGVVVPAWSIDPQAWMLVAGLPMQKAFMMNDRAAALGVLAVLMLLWPRKGEPRSGATLGAWISLAGLLIVICGDFALHGRMNQLLSDIQTANTAGQAAASADGHAAFSKLHPIATGLMGLRMLLLLIGCVCIMVVLAPESWKKNVSPNADQSGPEQAGAGQS